MAVDLTRIVLSSWKNEEWREAVWEGDLGNDTYGTDCQERTHLTQAELSH